MLKFWGFLEFVDIFFIGFQRKFRRRGHPVDKKWVIIPKYTDILSTWKVIADSWRKLYFTNVWKKIEFDLECYTKDIAIKKSKLNHGILLN